MSEYQYYEFLAIDRPLSKEQMAELRALHPSRHHVHPFPERIQLRRLPRRPGSADGEIL